MYHIDYFIIIEELRIQSIYYLNGLIRLMCLNFYEEYKFFISSSIWVHM